MLRTDRRMDGMTDEGRSYRGGRLIIRFLKEGEISKGACSGAKHLFWKVMFSYHTVIHIFLCVCVCGVGGVWNFCQYFYRRLG